MHHHLMLDFIKANDSRLNRMLRGKKKEEQKRLKEEEGKKKGRGMFPDKK